MVSSGILCKVIQADNWALLAPYFLPVIVKICVYDRFILGFSILFPLTLVFWLSAHFASQHTLVFSTLAS
jgi:hypothetical protein